MRSPSNASRRALLLSGGLVLLVNVACGSDLTPFKEIDRLRILSISSDPPWLTRTSTVGPIPEAELTALVVNAPGTSTVTARYEWSWCPLRAAGTTDGAYQCVFSELAAGMGMEIPEELFDLGTAPTANLQYLLPPDQVREICEQLAMAELPAFVSVPECTDGFPVSVQLIVRQGTEQSVALKNVVLAFEADKVNDNPHITGLQAIDPANPATPIDVAADGSTTLKRGVTYRLEAAVDETDSEPYTYVPADTKVPETRRENLVITWFIEGGESDATRTGFLPQEDDSEAAWTRARTLEWTPPKKVDFERDTARLYLVIRDGRQGQSFIARTVKLEE